MRETIAVSGDLPQEVARRATELESDGFQMMGCIQGISEPDGRAFFWATMGKPKAINERELGAIEERARVIGIIRSEYGWKSADLLEKLH